MKYNDAKQNSQGIVRVVCSFLTLDTADPAVADMRGGPTASGAGGSMITSIVRTGVGGYLLTLAEGFRYVTAAHASIDDAVDALSAKVGAISNEGAGKTTAVTVAVQVRLSSASTATETTGRRVSVTLECKDSGNGT
jgi:hypothetical protein